MLKNCAVDFVEICNVSIRKVIIKDANRIFNSDKNCGGYCDFYFGVTFFGTHCIYIYEVICFASNSYKPDETLPWRIDTFQQYRSFTLEQFWSGIWWTPTERVELASWMEVVAEAKVSDFDVQVGVQQKIFRLSTTMTTNLSSDTLKLNGTSDIHRQTNKLMMKVMTMTKRHTHTMNTGDQRWSF